jgi:hypothetical protein
MLCLIFDKFTDNSIIKTINSFIENGYFLIVLASNLTCIHTFKKIECNEILKCFIRMRSKLVNNPNKKRLVSAI